MRSSFVPPSRLRVPFLVIAFVARAATASADDAPSEPSSAVLAPADDWDPRRSLTAGLGLLQPFALGGANVEVDVRYDRLVLSYSHGWSLEIPTTGAARDQHLRETVPVTTGLGVGIQHYIPAANLLVDLRAELKYHRFEFAVESSNGDAQRDLVRYSTVTMGAGLYGTFLPFARSERAIRGLAISLSVRVWPRVASTLDGNRLVYENETTGRTETHRTADIGFANTPVLANVSVGYLFGL